LQHIQGYMRNISIVLAICLILFGSCRAQQETLQENLLNINGVDCSIHGSSAPDRKEYVFNVLKNRYAFPADSELLKEITLQQLAASASDRDFPQDKAVIITATVGNVKVGGVESCNCKTKDHQYRDTHIELIPDAQHDEPRYRVIAEVTPRLRLMMAAKGVNWTTDELKHTLIGRKVRITGWLFYDAEHERESVANNPQGQHDWRATCWEIHPITAIEILND